MGLYDRDYMRAPPKRGRWDLRDPEGGPGPNRRWIWIAVVAVVVVVGLRVVLPYTQMWGIGGFGGPLPKLLETKTIDLGEFEVVSGSVAIGDPHDGRDLAVQGEVAMKLSNVANGRW